MIIGIIFNIEYSIYTEKVVKGVYRYCQEHSISLLSVPLKMFRNAEGHLDYAREFSSEYLVSLQLDGIIYLTSTLCFQVRSSFVVKGIKALKNIPVVSIGISIDGVTSIVTDDAGAVDDLIFHLVHKHGKQRFAVLTGYRSSPETTLRLIHYIRALKQNDIELDYSHLFFADYSYSSAFESLRRKFKSAAEIDFEVLLTMNDAMAFGAYEYFSSLGLKIPDDIILTGFDDAFGTGSVTPLLTTIDPVSVRQGYKAAEFIHRLILKKKTPVLTRIPARVCYRQTCGCMTADLFSLAQENEEFRRQICTNVRPSDFFSKAQTVYRIRNLFDIEFPQYFGCEFSDCLSDCFMEFGFRAAFICVYRESVCIGSDTDKLIIPDEAEIVVGYNTTNGYKKSDAGIFRPGKQFAPDCFFEPGTSYLMYPLFNGSYMTGYMVCDTGFSDYYYLMLFLQFTAKVINSRVQYRSQQQESVRLINEKELLEKSNENLCRLSRTDSMTELLNRRGLMEYGQQMIDAAVEVKNTGMVLFADMDGLKSINDQYGHDAGDRAIQAEAKILRKVFRTSDVLSRIGGDEFAVVSVGMTSDAFDRTEKYLELLTNEWNIHENVPFKLSISMGAVPFYRGKSLLNELLKQADFEQYAKKRKKKNRIPLQ